MILWQVCRRLDGAGSRYESSAHCFRTREECEKAYRVANIVYISAQRPEYVAYLMNEALIRDAPPPPEVVRRAFGATSADNIGAWEYRDFINGLVSNRMEPHGITNEDVAAAIGMYLRLFDVRTIEITTDIMKVAGVIWEPSS